MIETDEIYRRCKNHYSMEKDEIDALVLQGTDYQQYSTDEEKLNAFYDDLLKANKATIEDATEDADTLPKDDRKLDDGDEIRLKEIRKEKKRRKQTEKSLDEQAFEAAGEHLAPADRLSFADLQESLKDLDLSDDDEDEEE